MYVLMENIKKIVSFNVERKYVTYNPKMCIIGMDNDQRIMKTIRILSRIIKKEFNADYVLVNVLGRNTNVSNSVSANKDNDSDVGGQVDHLLNTISQLSDYDLVVLITNIGIGELVSRKILEWLPSKPKILMVTKISNYLSKLENEIMRMERDSRKIVAAIKKTLIRGGNIRIEWGKKSENRININIKKGISSSKLKYIISSNTGSLRGQVCSIPQGMIKINIGAISKYSDIEGKIKIKGEPIHNLKCPDDVWLKGISRNTYCEYTIGLIESPLKIRIKKCFVTRVADALENGLIKTITVGLNDLQKNTKLDLILSEEPYLVPYLWGFASLNIVKNQGNKILWYRQVMNGVKIFANGQRIY